MAGCEAKLVAIRIGENHPSEVPRSVLLNVRCAQIEGPLHRTVEVVDCHIEVEPPPSLDRLADSLKGDGNAALVLRLEPDEVRPRATGDTDLEQCGPESRQSIGVVDL